MGVARAEARCQDASDKKKIVDVVTKIKSKIAFKSDSCSKTTFLYIVCLKWKVLQDLEKE